MIVFQTIHQELFNYILHNFLEIEVFNEDTDLGDMIEILLPKYLYREQYRSCIKALKELFLWTEDSFYHEMRALHELLLFHFVEYMAELQQDLPDFNQIYIDEKGHSLIEQAIKADCDEDGDLESEDYREIYYDIFLYPDFLFTDTDFLLIDKIYNTRKAGKPFIEEMLGINIDYYFELLPMDIQEQYKTKHITLTSEISSMLKYIEKRIRYGNLYKLFWENNHPVKEERIQLILENIMDAYFYNQEVEITREALLGNGILFRKRRGLRICREIIYWSFSVMNVGKKCSCLSATHREWEFVPTKEVIFIRISLCRIGTDSEIRC